MQYNELVFFCFFKPDELLFMVEDEFYTSINIKHVIKLIGSIAEVIEYGKMIFCREGGKAC